MANFAKVNRAIRARFPGLKIEAVRGYGYIYFVGEDADASESICAHPVFTPTADVIRMAMNAINAAQ